MFRHDSHCMHYGNYRNLLSLKNNFVKTITYLVISLAKVLLSRNFLQKRARANFRHFHTVWKNEKFGLTEKIFRQINSLVICLVKPLLSRNFFRKSVRLKFHNFHTVLWSHCGNYGFYTATILSRKFRQINFLVFTKELHSIFQFDEKRKLRGNEFHGFPRCSVNSCFNRNSVNSTFSLPILSWSHEIFWTWSTYKRLMLFCIPKDRQIEIFQFC